MATVVKDFKVKAGLVVEGTTGTINNFDILTKKQTDQDYIVGLIGGTSTSENTPNTVVKRDANGDFSAGEVSVNRINVGSTGYIDEDDEILIKTNGNEYDIRLNADDIRLESQDDIVLEAGALGETPSNADVRLIAANGSIRLEGADIYAGASLQFVDSERVATRGYVDTAADSAQADAETFATTADSTLYGTVTTDIATAKTAAETFATTADTTLYGTVTTDIATAKTAAEATASADATTKANAAQSAAATDATTKANAAQAAAEATASADATSKANAAQSAAESFATTAVANLVDGAPAVLDTLNELALALQDNPDVIADLQGIAAGKQDELTAGANINITGATISVTGLSSGDISDFDSAAVSATEASYDVIGAAAAAQSAAEATASADATTKANAAQAAAEATASADATTKANAAQAAAEATASADATTKANDAEANAIAHADALDTDDIEEGSNNEYFTDVRAKSAAADLLTSATKTNITITGTGAGLTITAENGVADSTTTDLAEGTNLYFTNARAVTALEAVVPNFTAVEVNSVAKQVASTLTAATPGVQVGHAFAKADYRSAEFLVKVAYGTHTEISKVLLTLDTSDNIALTEYGIVGTNGSASSISAGVSGNNVQLLVTTINNNSTVTVVGTLLV